MTDEVTEEVIVKAVSTVDAVFAKALEYVEATESLVVDQAPLLIQEVLTYGFFYASFWCAFWAVLAVAAFVGATWAWRLMVKNKEDPFPAFLLGLFVGGGTLIGTFVCLFSAVKISVAPRLYLIEQLKDLM